MVQAEKSGFALRMTPSGVALLPIKEGKPMQEADYLALPPEQKKALEDKRGEIGKRVEETLREGKKVEREINQRLEELEKKAGEYLVAMPIAEMREKYRDNLKLLRYFDGVRDHILSSLHRFKAAEPDSAAAQLRRYHGSFALSCHRRAPWNCRVLPDSIRRRFRNTRGG